MIRGNQLSSNKGLAADEVALTEKQMKQRMLLEILEKQKCQLG